MIDAAGRMIRRFPALSLLAAGLWIAASPWLLTLLLRNLWTQDLLPDAVVSFVDKVGELPFAIVFYSGVGITAAAIGWMLVRLVIYTFQRFPI